MLLCGGCRVSEGFGTGEQPRGADGYRDDRRRAQERCETARAGRFGDRCRAFDTLLQPMPQGFGIGFVVRGVTAYVEPEFTEIFVEATVFFPGYPVFEFATATVVERAFEGIDTEVPYISVRIHRVGCFRSDTKNPVDPYSAGRIFLQSD